MIDRAKRLGLEFDRDYLSKIANGTHKDAMYNSSDNFWKAIGRKARVFGRSPLGERRHWSVEEWSFRHNAEPELAVGGFPSECAEAEAEALKLDKEE
jgi:hypothetical protein